jgi:hypothetical protein
VFYVFAILYDIFFYIAIINNLDVLNVSMYCHHDPSTVIFPLIDLFLLTLSLTAFLPPLPSFNVNTQKLTHPLTVSYTVCFMWSGQISQLWYENCDEDVAEHLPVIIMLASV